MGLLIGEDFSPWTEKACWALDHHRVKYAFRQYEPLVDEPWLRWKTRNFTGKATVPALIDEGENGPARFLDSFTIARHAEASGAGEPLFPSGEDAIVAEWNDTSEEALRAGRALFFARLATDRAAQIDNLPPWVPGGMRPMMRPLVSSGVAFLRKKHGVDEAFVETARDRLDATLRRLRGALSGSPTLLESFSYADVAMAVVFQFVQPVDDRYMPLTAANRACWTEPALAAQHRDLIEWRDRLYARHRARKDAT